MNILKRSYKWFLRKFFKKERRETAEDTTAAFLTSAAKLASSGRATLFRGGIQAYGDALMDPDKITYILSIDIGKSRRRMGDKKWFKQYVEKERERGVL